MERKTQAVLILYTKEFKYCLFKIENSDSYSIINDTIDESNDNFCPFLTIARYIVTKINQYFSYPSLQKLITPTSQKDNFCIQDHFQLSYEYNEWYYMLQEALQYDGFSDQHIIYMQQIENEDIFMQNMQQLGVNCQLFSQEQIQQNTNIIDALTFSIFNKVNIQDKINWQIQLKLSPPSKETSYIYIIQNNAKFSEKLRSGNLPMPAKTFFYGMFKKDYQKWYTYNVSLGEYPTKEILRNVGTIVMAGSPYSAYGEQDWIRAYREWILDLYYNYPDIRILGICFGEQILAHTLGGLCDVVKERKANKEFYNRGTQKLYMTDKFFDIPFIKQLNLKTKQLYITKLHGDVVVKLDENKFEVVGSSDNYKIEAYVDVNKDLNQNPRILCFQGHPEYSNKWLTMRDIQYYSFHHNMKEQDALKKSIYGQQVNDDSQQLRAICQSFLLLGYFSSNKIQPQNITNQQD